MKTKIAIVPKAQRKVKTAPDATVYLTPKGERVTIAKTKQFPVHPSEPEWLKEIKTQSNEDEDIVRISDGRRLWGYKREDLTLEK